MEHCTRLNPPSRAPVRGRREQSLAVIDERRLTVIQLPLRGEGSVLEVQRTAILKNDQRLLCATAVIRQPNLNVGSQSVDRGRKRRSPSPPSEPAVRFSRDGLSSQLFPHRDWRAN